MKMKKVPIEKDKYSDSSKNSVGHEFLGEYYRDIHYKCSKCYKPAIFTAIDQKITYESRKKYMWSFRRLCEPCWKEMHQIKENIAKLGEEYQQNKLEKSKDREFLKTWLEELQEYSEFGKGADQSRINSIKNMLQKT